MKAGHLGLAKIRSGTKIVIEEQDQAGITENAEIDVRFWHRDGLFGVEYKLATTTDWPVRGSMLLHEWDELDGEITYQPPIISTADTMLTTDATGAMIFHTGVWSLIDPPKFRTCGFLSSSTYIPVMPCDIDPETGVSAFDAFPSNGQVDCDGYKYTFAGKNSFFADDAIRGPFQLRNIMNWDDPDRYETDLDDSYHFSGSRAVEFFDFAWRGSSAHHNDFLGALVCTNTGYSWLAGETFFKPWITTGGQVVFERERMRIYAEAIPEEANNSMVDKVWLTNGLTSILPTVGNPKVTESNTEVTVESAITHAEGAFVYVDSNDSILCSGFMGVSGADDNTIEGLLDRVCRISGTQAAFPGDSLIATSSLAENGTVNV
jgi:hypothetical protein